MNKLKGKVALVTGASRGIGRAIVEDIVAQGGSVVLAARNAEPLDALAAELVGKGRDVLAVPTDMADPTAIGQLVAATKEHFGKLDILVNNAGVTLAAAFEASTTEMWDRVHAVNARGPFILCREALPLLRAAQPGYIVNISSVVGVKGYAQQAVYTASKHALRGMSIALAEELRHENIRVHVICPGGVLTDMVTQVRPDIKTDELMDPREISEAVLYLITQSGNAVIDEIRLRRRTSGPWF